MADFLDRYIKWAFSASPERRITAQFLRSYLNMGKYAFLFSLAAGIGIGVANKHVMKTPQAALSLFGADPAIYAGLLKSDKHVTVWFGDRMTMRYYNQTFGNRLKKPLKDRDKPDHSDGFAESLHGERCPIYISHSPESAFALMKHRWRAYPHAFARMQQILKPSEIKINILLHEFGHCAQPEEAYAERDLTTPFHKDLSTRGETDADVRAIKGVEAADPQSRIRDLFLLEASINSSYNNALPITYMLDGREISNIEDVKNARDWFTKFVYGANKTWVENPYASAQHNEIYRANVYERILYVATNKDVPTLVSDWARIHAKALLTAYPNLMIDVLKSDGLSLNNPESLFASAGMSSKHATDYFYPQVIKKFEFAPTKRKPVRRLGPA